MLSMVLFLVAFLMVGISCSIICHINIVLPGGDNQRGLAVIRFRGCCFPGKREATREGLV